MTAKKKGRAARFLPLLEGFIGESAAAYQKARQALRRIVFESKSSISLENNFLLLLSCELSGLALPGYATLDFDHAMEIKETLEKIKDYLNDSSQKRPLNLLMLASPGAGKSHFIKCIAKKLGAQNIGPVTYNMVGLQRHEDLIPPLDAARNFKVEDRLPLLFLDEFDSQETNYALLLPLLWDGQITLGQSDLKLGKVVVVLAGSNPKLRLVMGAARKMSAKATPVTGSNPKIVDLLSRINGGVIEIPPLSDRADKICITVALLRQRFGPSLERVPLALLRFAAATEFRYGVRSIAHLIDLIPYREGLDEITLSNLSLPIGHAGKLRASSLAYHLLSKGQSDGIVDSWEKMSARSAQVLISQDRLRYFTDGLTEEDRPTAKGLLGRIDGDIDRAAQRE